MDVLASEVGAAVGAAEGAALGLVVGEAGAGVLVPGAVMDVLASEVGAAVGAAEGAALGLVVDLHSPNCRARFPSVSFKVHVPMHVSLFASL